ncbi:isopenicillin N synthase family oxygenase [Kaistia dalseonensis]|uniref:2-oxoglutarate-dependent ethylene/succinate-forming enzyme n=1 Tax=Kaistia dalseonensis TaxID=410840 RepID=A0ABU0H3S5_9HYPH|nr:2-oxoglutarate and iron-dependent oxygenase domain-containing protein [Kaistia dalseonensis]MCX5494353.1 isopenicillin N synthase family oxygenase [Kaistia dalseonensis]MDQ0436935.1 isopenicillin N synthase-like dioxygenase [Kaistia dalseonensis]
MSELPIIDFSGMYSADIESRRAVARHVRAACLENGFFYLSHTGVTADQTERVLAAARQFFDLPEAVKLTIDKSQSNCGRGYERMGGQRLEAGAQADRKEAFMMGTELPADDPQLAGLSHYGPNLWPEGMDAWRAEIEGYRAAMIALAHRIMACLALSLDVAEDYFDPCFVDSISSLRLLHYPPQPANAGADARGAGAHTDWGAITILLQDDVGGLQVKDGDDGWIDAPPIPGAFIINLGDLVPRWTNGLYRSTTHRVINRSGRERYSIPFFFDGRGDYVSETIPTCLAPGELPKFTPLSVSEHLAHMLSSTRAM